MEKQKLDALRQRAEALSEPEKDVLSENSNEELRAALQELRIYDIELELQNEELRRVQEELTETRDQYIDLYDFAPIGYLTLNDKNLIVEANLTAVDLLGEERKSFLRSHHFSHLIVPEDQDIFYKHFREVLASTNRFGCELRMRRTNGDLFWAHLESVSVRKSDKTEPRIRIALQDITEAKQQEGEILNAKKVEATAIFAGGITHDFNNLLAGILGNIEMAQEDLLAGRSISKKLQAAKDACLRAADLTKRFLIFAAGGEPLTKLASVEELIKDSASFALAGSNVKFEYSLQDRLWPVEVDTGLITQALGNVVTNAQEAMPQGGIVLIRAENVDSIPGKKRKLTDDQKRKYVKLSIVDQGIGIPKDSSTRVFDPYFSSKKMGAQKGQGLGLTISHSIIQKHGGSIDIASKQNGGTTVTIYLPAVNKQIAAQKVKPQKVLSCANKKILVMDDEKLLRNVTRCMLENLGYEVEVACDGEEAIQKYSKAKGAGSPFGLVILDLTIKGGMGGGETIKRLQGLDPDVRAVVASGYSEDPIMANCREYGFLDALQKPYLYKELEKSVRSIIGAADDA